MFATSSKIDGGPAYDCLLTPLRVLWSGSILFFSFILWVSSLELIPPVNPVSCNVFQKSLCIHTMKFVAVAKTPVHVYKATCAHATINRKSWKIVADAVSCSIFFLSNPFRACWNHILTFSYIVAAAHMYILLITTLKPGERESENHPGAVMEENIAR